MPQRRKLALHTHGLAILAACGPTLSTELFSGRNFVPAFVTTHRSCGLLLFGGVLLRELRHQRGEFRGGIKELWLVRQGVSHQARHWRRLLTNGGFLRSRILFRPRFESRYVFRRMILA